MADMLAKGLAYLTEMREEHMTRPAVYARITGRGVDAVRHEAEIAVTQAPISPDEQPFVAPAGAAPGYHAAERCDFLLTASQLVINSVLVRPQDGDLIEIAQGEDQPTRRFEVTPRDLESCYRESDPLGTTLRVHTVRVDDAVTNPVPPLEEPEL